MVHRYGGLHILHTESHGGYMWCTVRGATFAALLGGGGGGYTCCIVLWGLWWGWATCAT